jgi:hypothetical protein
MAQHFELLMSEPATSAADDLLPEPQKQTHSACGWSHLYMIAPLDALAVA